MSLELMGEAEVPPAREPSGSILDEGRRRARRGTFRGRRCHSSVMIRSAKLIALIAPLLGLLMGSEAAADELSSTRSQPLAEVSHSVELRIDEGLAIYTVRRTFANTGILADEAQLDIDLPTGAAVTGLRIRARDRWYSADLLEAEEAAEKYRELTSLGAWKPKDPALMQWVWADRMHLQVFPVLPGQTSTVEYTLTAPLHYRAGRYLLSYPRFVAESGSQRPLATPQIRIDPGHGDLTTTILIDGKPAAPDTPVVLGAPQSRPWIGEGAPSPSASYAWSRLEVAQTGTARAAKLSVDIDHTYSGDLQLELVTPAGRRIFVADFESSDNDVHSSFDVEFDDDTQIAGAWHLVVSDHAGLDVGTLDAWSLELAAGPPPSAMKFRSITASDVPVFIPDAPQGGGAESLAIFEIEPPTIRDVEARFGRVVVADGINFLRLEVEAAPQLRELPRRASVVFVLDASRSAASVSSQVDIARAYMAHVSDAKAEIVVFRRHAQRLTGDFQRGDDLWRELALAEESGALEQGNGSHLERGLEVAATALKGRPGPKRIVLLTDGLLRSRFANDDAALALKGAPRGTIAHIVIPHESASETRLFRDDAHPLAAIPEASGGVLYGLDSADWSAHKELSPAVLGLVRPIGIDNFEVLRGLGQLEDAPTPPDTLREGTAYGFMLNDKSAPRQVVLTGKIWGRSFRRKVHADRRFSDATAAFVFSEDEHHDLSPEQMMKVALRGRAVSPVTSYLAVEPGVRPMLIGLEGTGSGAGGVGVGGVGYGGGGLSSSGVGGARRAWTIPELMTTGISACVAEHRPQADWSVDLQVETTYQEIVDVIVADRPSALERCLLEAAWAVNLTWNFSDERRTYPLRLGQASGAGGPTPTP